MTSILRNTILAAAVAATAVSAIPAQAGDGWHGHDRRVYVERDRGSDALAAGIAGLAVGAIVGSVLAQPPRRAQPVYIDPPYDPYPRPVYRTYREPEYRYRSYEYYRPAPVRRSVTVSAGLEPWSREWYRACSARYRSFNPSTGTFTTYGGEQRFCQP
ncbi:BA14K family protein [Nitratireductor luteus]|uniref:BA14K family protein n=1 Tax=Nitratireductor luteus TaxID=2976980 RepID=UPI00223F8547|nr:BA14K family protein [Nitratireductor luteus]